MHTEEAPWLEPNTPPPRSARLQLSPVFSGLQELPAPQELQHLPLRTPALRLRQGLQAPRRGIASYASSGWVGLTPARCVLAFSGCRAAGAARSGPLGWKEFPGPWRDCRGSIESLVSGTEGRGWGFGLTVYLLCDLRLPLWASVSSS